MRTSILLRPAAAILLPLAAACSQPTGIAQVDRAKDTLRARLPTDPALDEVGDAAQGAVRDADAAGRTGSVGDMATAVGRGAGRVLCAGAAATGPARREIGRTASRELAHEPGTRPLVDAYRRTADALPAAPDPCP